jgi:molybdopterin biosynthesis enzyme MoaB
LELKIERLGLSETDKAGLKEGKKPASMSQSDFDSIQVDYNAVKSD